MKQKLELKSPLTDRSYNVKSYNSKARETYLQNEKIARQQKLSEEEEKKTRIEKVKKYKQLIKEQYQPKID